MSTKVLISKNPSAILTKTVQDMGYYELFLLVHKDGTRQLTMRIPCSATDAGLLLYLGENRLDYNYCDNYLKYTVLDVPPGFTVTLTKV